MTTKLYRHRWPEDDALAVIDLYLRGKTYTQIARKYRTTRNAISGLLHRCDVHNIDRPKHLRWDKKCRN